MDMVAYINQIDQLQYGQDTTKLNFPAKHKARSWSNAGKSTNQI
jgi:hypothetical protein